MRARGEDADLVAVQASSKSRPEWECGTDRHSHIVLGLSCLWNSVLETIGDALGLLLYFYPSLPYNNLIIAACNVDLLGVTPFSF